LFSGLSPTPGRGSCVPLVASDAKRRAQAHPEAQKELEKSNSFLFSTPPQY
jgi:hypothetical protein